MLKRLIWLIALLTFTSQVYIAGDAKPDSDHHNNNPDAKRAADNDRDDDDSAPGADDKSPATILYRDGMKLLRQKSFDKAISKFNESLAVNPRQPRVYMALGRALEDKGAKPEEAEKAYRDGLKLDTQKYRLWQRLANILYFEQKYDEARQACHNAISLNPPKKVEAEIERLIQRIESGRENGQMGVHQAD